MELVNVRYDGYSPGDNDYGAIDRSLMTSVVTTSPFRASSTDYIEYFIYDLNGNIIARRYDSQDYRPGELTPDGTGYTTLLLNPEQDVRRNNVARGTTLIRYNFHKYLFGSNVGNRYWIKEVSPSRTEIKVTRQDLSNLDMQAALQNRGALLGSGYYPDFLINFGDNILLIATNIVYIEEGGVGYYVIKLYEALPFEYDVKDQFWIVEKVAESAEFRVTVEIEPEQVNNNTTLRGPNYKVDIASRQNQTTPYYNYNTLFSSPVTSSLQQLQSWFEDKAVSINVDYSDFNNFIHFSSATERLLNFAYKISLIESYRADIVAGTNLSSTPGSIITNTNITLQRNIDNIISKFDPYEYYLYYDSASTAWPKATNIKPYELYSVTSSQALNWLGSISTPPTPTQMSMLYSASLYDELNNDNLLYTAPAYLRDDSSNNPYTTFLHMIGQHFDNIWIYYKDVSNRYVADNNPQSGISLDLVANALRSFGIELYTNSNISDNIYYSLLGLNDVGLTIPITSSAYGQIVLSSSSIYPLTGNDYLSQSIYTPPFSEEKINRYVTTFQTPATDITASFGMLPPNQLEKELYKRIYHNLPYLLKAKGTQRGIKALIACYGIPSSILTVNEFGGNNIFTEPGIQQIQNQKIFTGSLLELSSSLLSPYTTLQYYQNNTERSSLSVEVGFSPADSINAHITGTLGNFNIMQYVGNPTLQYSNSYGPLDTLSNDYFATHYSNRYNVWDFIRLIKYYNNSLFKSIKDYVPARSSTTSAIIVKSHILERNKYARHEPVVTQPEYSQSIDLLRVSAGNPEGVLPYRPCTRYSILGLFSTAVLGGGGLINYLQCGTVAAVQTRVPQGVTETILADDSIPVQLVAGNAVITALGAAFTEGNPPGLNTAYNESVNTPLGSVQVTRDYDIEPYTGEFSGSIIDPTTGYFEQTEQSSITAPWTSSVEGRIDIYTTYSLNYLYQNVTGAVKSTRFLDLDYSTDPYVPVNYGLITQSIDTYPASLNNPYAPFAELQDYNYYLRRSVLPRYEGSKTISLRYNTYTGPGTASNWNGDSSYGNTPAIDWNSYKLGWVKTIPTESKNFYDKTTINLKYLIDSDLNVTELSANNDNVIEVQNIFKSGNPVKISITDTQFPSNQVQLNGVKTIYRGGYRFDPILFRESNEGLVFNFANPVSESLGYVGVLASDARSYRYNAFGANNNRGLFDSCTPDKPSSTTPPSPTQVYQIGYGYNVLTQTIPSQILANVASYPGYTYQPGQVGTQYLPNQSIASSVYNILQWRGFIAQSNQSTNQQLNEYFDSTSGPAYNPLELSVYSFTLPQYDLQLYNREPNPATYDIVGDPYHYKVPRSGNYTIKARVPFYFNGLSFGYIVGNQTLPGNVTLKVSFKIFVTAEKSDDIANPNSWKILGNSIIAPSTTTPSVGYFNQYNQVYYRRSQGTSAEAQASNLGIFNCDLNLSGINLLEGEYIRFRFYLMDCVNLFGKGYGYNSLNGFFYPLGNIGVNVNRAGVGRFEFQIGDLAPTYNRDKAPFIEIYDESTQYTVYDYDLAYNTTAAPIFTTSSVSQNVFNFSYGLASFITSASIFTPTSFTENYYTPVIDTFSIQPLDLIRVGKFRSTNPQYYTVATVATQSRASVSLTGDFTATVVAPSQPTISTFTYPVSSFNNNQFYVGDIISIAGATQAQNNVTGVRITNITQNTTNNTVILSLDTTAIVSETAATITITFLNNNVSYVVTVDRNINTNATIAATDFAILRPKADETSVIIDYKKPPGLVAQTLLLPENANKTLIENTGNIYQSLNIQLS